MNDYGHDLLFGSFVTPVAQPAQHGVDLALVSEQAGLDLVTFQDHPYQPSFHDTSTLLTYVASRTQKIAVSGNVTSLPLRPPLGLARAAATVDRLSGGRFRLGIGAGAFWDGIARMGGRKLTPAQGVAALREAIGIIRDAWDPDQQGPLNHEGPFYRIEDGDRTPYAHRPIPIWVGSYKPRMLALTGAVADGWLPSIEYIDGGLPGLADANHRIDDAAHEAGREPAAVRRLMNFMRASLVPTGQGFLDGPPEVWIDRLTMLALEHGISTFLIGGDDPTTLTRFGTEIAPAVRENVAHARR
ncbi:LLM class flavin-dependent oxidoreductase [Actinoplanes sp. M2I2]|uniref:LLM class flavin-dependent oxidoreductase n=1 Tax=Actinoplanes sp. M2I2 TaxID=1734444 RepID=UPI002020D6B4|nr:LLM class flavin-dependent oxidoreductase [Actinoplanes sp. M2I2]